ncbi:Hypothetical predicted protein, partial [Mytilus galloprovincialis]
NQQQQPSTNLPVTPTKPRFFQPICPSPTPPIPPPPKNYTVDYKHAKYYSSDSAIDSPDLSGNSITMTTNDDLDELSKLDQLGLNLHAPHAKDNEIVEILIQNGAIVNSTDKYGWTPLHKAAYSGYVHRTKVLISKNAMVNAATNDMRTALHLATEAVHHEIIFVLINAHANVNAKNNENQTALHVTKDKQVAEMLIKNGADANSRDIHVSMYYSGNTPLHQAAYNGQNDTMKYLIRIGANTSVQNNKNETPLDLAKNLEVAEIIIRNGDDVNSRGDSALHVAASKLDSNAVKCLISLGANVSARNNEGQTPLDILEETYKTSHWYIEETKYDWLYSSIKQR